MYRLGENGIKRWIRGTSGAAPSIGSSAWAGFQMKPCVRMTNVNSFHQDRRLECLNAAVYISGTARNTMSERHYATEEASVIRIRDWEWIEKLDRDFVNDMGVA